MSQKVKREGTTIARVRQKGIKEAAKKILARYWPEIQEIWEKSEEIEGIDQKKAANYRFEMYKDLVGAILDTSSKTMRNRVAGYLITLIKQVIYLQRISISELRAKYGLRAGGPELESETVEASTEKESETEEEETSSEESEE